ncbi:hypothetical protein CTEN210_17591 [Chaetoceros tenuissimus]|uniref:Chromo domain-containing protein n=1 Tax=Chaetoceros tenuissimus TaxID=426638 RepID=A0AAD3HEX3_9STRA|nr:hypothetical protein CTEN210_17591 [Chaetoceros tenuissimus]
MKLHRLSFITALVYQQVSGFTTNTILSRGVSSAESFRKTTFVAAEEKKDDDCDSCGDKKDSIILQPFIPGLDANYKNIGPVGEGDFIISRTGGPTKEELLNENILKIVRSECTDLEALTLVWKCLGYRFNEDKKEWEPTEVFPNWKKNFPTPPDLIGMARIYSKEVDEPSLRSNQSLVRSIPMEHKQMLKPILKPYGFTGFKLAELTPNKTRRAQCSNWLLFYREELFGYTVEELKEKRRLKKEAEEAEKRRLEEENGGPVEEQWTPPIKEVF